MKRMINHNIVLSFVVICLANTISFAQDATIRGRVNHGDEVLPSASVSLAGKSMLTDEKGEFSEMVKPGTYTIIITHAGYKKMQQTVIANAGIITNIDFDMTAADELEEIIMVGFRAKSGRTNLNTAVPVDVFSGSQLVETGQISLTQILNFLAPSFNASREILNETATLRGLDPQHVLILINGIRYHPMAFIFSGNLKGQLGKGSVGNDLNSIPFSAIEKIEVLRDGATAQYGSDAIGGVINIRLKKITGKTSLQIHSGQFYKDDGEKFSAGLYHGFLLKNKSLPSDRQGFLGLSATYRSQESTSRGGIYDWLVYKNYPSTPIPRADSIRIKRHDDSLVQLRGFNRQGVADNIGITKLTSTGVAINGGYPINSRTEIFLTIMLNSRRLERDGFYRLPRDSARVNFFLFPDGFQPRFKSNTVDVSVTPGIKGTTKKDWYWDITSSYGINSVRHSATNTNNASQTLILGANAPTSFYTGTDIFKQLTNDINFTKQLLLSANQFKSLNFSWGAEWRLENYVSRTGEEASWKNYDAVNYPQGGAVGAGPENAINKSRHVFGGYAELESEFKNNLLLNLAGRYEYYSDFGSNMAGKIAARYRFSKNFLLRASVNNGFRAPSLQQRYLTTINLTSTPARILEATGTFPNTHEVVKALNITSLTAERSININGGFASTFLKKIHLTIDAYWIQIKDRIIVSGNFRRIPGNTLDAILNLYPQFNAIKSISFYSNAINTKTKGIDIVLDGNWNYKKESFGISLAANFNSTRLYGAIKTSDKLSTIAGSSTTLFNSEEKTRIEKGQPDSKIILSLNYTIGKIKLNIRNTRFGKTMIAPLSLIPPFSPNPEFFSSKILTDVSLAYYLKPWATITAGVNNITNVYPDRLKIYENTANSRLIYSPEGSPFGFNGGYYFLNMSFNF
ncbi:MAG: TonB-dependent receptor [Chitinophagaceae bacterium]